MACQCDYPKRQQVDGVKYPKCETCGEWIMPAAMGGKDWSQLPPSPEDADAMHAQAAEHYFTGPGPMDERRGLVAQERRPPERAGPGRRARDVGRSGQ